MAKLARTTFPPLAWIACAFIAACSSASSPAASPGPDGSSTAARVFVGDVTGTDARVAVVATTTHARLYFCGGSGSFTTKTHWLASVAIAGASVSLPSPDSGGWKLDGTVADTGVSGTVTMGTDGEFPFHAIPVASTTIAGLYEAVGPCGKIGVIVSQPSSTDEPTLQGACVGSGTGKPSVEQVNPIRPVARLADGTIAVLVDNQQVALHATAAPAD